MPTPLTVFAGGSSTSRPARAASVDDSERGASVSVSQASDTTRVKTARSLTRFLPRLLTSSRDLFSHLTSPNDGSISNDDDDWSQGREDWKESLEYFRRHYLQTAGDTVIRPSYVLNSLGVGTDSILGLKASRIAAVTNLATLLDEIIQIQEDDDPLPTLQGWDMEFPEFFVEGPDAVEGQVPRIVSIVNNIRTQRLIFTLYKLNLAGPDAIELAARFFCEDTVSGPILEDLVQHKAPISFRPIPFVTFHSDTDENVISRFNAIRITSIVECLQESRNLEEENPLEGLIKVLREFVEDNFRRISEQLEAQASGQAWDPSRHFSSSTTSQAENQQIQSQLESEALGQALGGVESRYLSLFFSPVESSRVLTRIIL